MDSTGLSVLLFAYSKFLILLILIIAMVGMMRKFFRDEKMHSETTYSSINVFKLSLLNNWVKLLSVIAFGLAVLWLFGREMPYRPKTVINQSNPLLRDRLKDVDRFMIPDIRKEEERKYDYSEKNREQNRQSVESFKKIEK